MGVIIDSSRVNLLFLVSPARSRNCVNTTIMRASNAFLSFDVGDSTYSGASHDFEHSRDPRESADVWEGGTLADLIFIGKSAPLSVCLLW